MIRKRSDAAATAEETAREPDPERAPEDPSEGEGPGDRLGGLDPEAEQAEADDGAEGGATPEEGSEGPEVGEDADGEPPEEPFPEDLPDRIEAVLFASAQPLAAARLGRVLGVETALVKRGLDLLQERWAAREGAIDLVAIAGGFRFMTRSAFAQDLEGLAKKGKVERLSPAALETLAVIAYRQPITRADVESVRGVAVGPVLRVLQDRDLIRVTGKSPDPGHPLLYGTTKRFLDHFGLASLKHLPDIKDLQERP